MRAGRICVLSIALALAVVSARDDAAAQRIAPVATEEFHADAGVEQVWNDVNYNALLIAIARLEEHGLDPEHYGLSSLRTLRTDEDARDRVATASWLTAAAHLLYGKTDPVMLEPSWAVAPREADFADALLTALADGTVGRSLEAFAPRQPLYAAMRDELVRQQNLGEDPIVRIDEGPTLRLGDTGPRVAALRQRLQQLGWLPEAGGGPDFDEGMAIAVEGFQASEGQEADGIVGPATLRALNRSPSERADQLRVNMERFRWLPTELGRRHLRANIANFDVTAFEDGEPVRTYLTIVGRPYRATPVFSDEIEYIVFNPWWETPRSLAVADKLPLFQSDPGAVDQLGFQVLDADGNRVDASTIDWNSLSRSNFPYRIRQAPGPMNALGLVKIMFPNPHNVYIHDTPTRGLFSQRQRAFSSGCLRTQDPIALAEWLLEETDGWNADRIDMALETGRENRVDLTAHVPVHILYQTVIADGAGGVRFLDDIYQRDPAVLSGLETPPPRGD